MAKTLSRAPMSGTPRAVKHREHGRSTFGGTLTAIVESLYRLAVRRGGLRRVIDTKTGEVLEDRREPTKTLWLNVGDTLVVCGHDVDNYDAVAIARVAGVEPDGVNVRVRLERVWTHGADVWVLPARRAT